MRARVLVPVALLALAVLGAAWFVENYERMPAVERVPASGEARLREFLAAERFAERMGLPARELRSLVELDALPRTDVLVMPARRQSLDAPRIARLARWVQAGGHLIVEAEHPAIDDPLLDRLGVGRKADRQPSAAPPPGGAFNAVPVRVELPTSERALSVMFNQDSQLEFEAKNVLVRARHQGSLKLVSFRYGKGVVTACTSLDFARNDRIGMQDDAEFFWRLSALTPAASLAVFFHPERLSLWRFLGEHAAPVLAGGLALLALWLWRIVPRFGPVVPDAPPARRRLLDHLRASGRYLWTQGLRARLARAARDAALRRLARAQPDFAVATATEKAARIAALAGVAAEDGQRFMAGGALRGGDFMRLVAIAQRVHLALEKGSR
ncbi:MAG TPA: DUF4350 domain-containing protein [Burkholderiales bacterium]|nr:DUF4350 domain-containing protein [Burkholderiales bacterium]